MGKYTANIFSVLFHPLFIPMYGAFIVFNSQLYINYTLSEEAKSITYLIIFINTCLVPALLAFFLYKKGSISDMMMSEQSERGLPYLMIAIFYFTTYFLLAEYAFPELISTVLLAAAISLVILFFANFISKVSAHMVGLGGLIGIVFGLSQFTLNGISPFLFPLIIITGFVAYSRLKLEAHTPAQIYSGLLIGFLCEYLFVADVLGST